MGIPTRLSEDPTSDAMRRAGRALGGRASAARLFLEERFDLRLDMDGEGGRSLACTALRGAALDEDDSLHLTDPSLEQVVALAEGSSRSPLDRGKPTPGERWPGPGAEAAIERRVALEPELQRLMDRAARSISEGRWSARLVAFIQTVWVVDSSADVLCDVRTGTRAELVLRSSRHPKIVSIVDHVFRGDGGGLEGLNDRVVSAAELYQDRSEDDPPPPPGETTVVLAPGVGGIVAHELVGHALEGDAHSDAGTWILSTLPSVKGPLTIIDDPGRGRAPWRIDDEGEASRAVVLVDRGIATGVLLDRRTALARGASSTGHGRRSSYLAPVRARMGCTWIEPGADDPRSAIEDTSEGVFIRRMAAGQTDPVRGRASFVVTEAQRIVKGRLDRPLGSFVLVMEAQRAWPSIDRICNDLAFDTCVGSCVRDGQPLAVSVGAPTIRIGVVNVAC